MWKPNPISTCPPRPPAPPGVCALQGGRDNCCCVSRKMGLRNGRRCQEAQRSAAALSPFSWAACPTGGGPVLPQTVGPPAIEAGRLLGRRVLLAGPGGDLPAGAVSKRQFAASGGCLGNAGTPMLETALIALAHTLRRSGPRF